MFFRCACLATLTYTAFISSDALAAFGGGDGVCVVPDRAIVFYDDILYVMEKGTFVISEYLEGKRFAKIAGKLPDSVRLLSGLSGGELRGMGHKVYIVSSFLADKGKKLGETSNLYLSATRDNRLTLIPGTNEANVKWQDRTVGGQSLSINGNYSTTIFLIERLTDDSTDGSFITVSDQATEVKDKQGNPLFLYPLVLGEWDKAARFETIDFSGK